MKIGIFWFGSFNETVRLSVQALQRQPSSNSKLELFVQGETEGATTIGKIAAPYPYEAVNALCHVYYQSIQHGFDYAVIHFGNAILLSLKKLEMLLVSKSVQESIFSFRIAEIRGVAQRGSPRLPLIDENCIILNLKKAIERKFIERKLIHASHFSHVGYNHAVLLSFIEYALTKDEVANHFDAKTSFDRFGNQIGTMMEPFHLCTKTGCLVAYPELDKAVMPLILANIAMAQRGEKSAFLKENFMTRLFRYTKKRVWKTLPNYELKKTYNSN